MWAEFSGFPKLTYYDNLTIEMGWSHNQGRAGNRDDFWPYTVYQYNHALDTYENMASVDAWDKTLTETGPGGEMWPAELDDGEGLVYWIMQQNTNYDASDLVSAEEYRKWREMNFGRAHEVDIPFHPLTTENIAAIAMPRVSAIS